MRLMKSATLLVTALALTAGMVYAGSNKKYTQDSETTKLFREANQSADYFKRSVGYAVFPTIGKGGLGVGAAHGQGNVYAGGRRIGSVTMNQLSIGFQAGGQAYSQIIFFANQKALNEFTSGNYEFSADVGAIAITASAAASAGTAGTDASASATKHDATNAGDFTNGMAVFTIAKGGLMYNATVAGQKFSYKQG